MMIVVNYDDAKGMSKKCYAVLQMKYQSCCEVGNGIKEVCLTKIERMSRPGIEPGSMQPQCIILTTVRSRPTAAEHIAIHIYSIRTDA